MLVDIRAINPDDDEMTIVGQWGGTDDIVIHLTESDKHWCVFVENGYLQVKRIADEKEDEYIFDEEELYED